MINFLGITIHLYGLLIGAGILVCWEMASYFSAKKSLPNGLIDRIGWWIVVSGIAGARLYHVIDLWNEYYVFNPSKIFFVWEGGLAIWGAIVGGLMGFLLYHVYSVISGKLIRVNYLSVLDCVVVGLPLSQAIGRLGNWINGELMGKNGEPLFLYEMIPNILLFAILFKLSFRKTNPGVVLSLYLIGYGIIRIILENFRAEEVIWRISGIPVAAIFSLLSITTGLFLLISKKRGS